MTCDLTSEAQGYANTEIISSSVVIAISPLVQASLRSFPQGVRYKGGFIWEVMLLGPNHMSTLNYGIETWPHFRSSDLCVIWRYTCAFKTGRSVHIIVDIRFSGCLQGGVPLYNLSTCKYMIV